MEKQSKFLQLNFYTGDDENIEYYLIIIEIKSGVPSMPVLIAKYPDAPIRFFMYPYVLN